ncbi:MAG: hypothetical protein IH623_22240 [Verrucomicrobia bacterium]|nr:hypothetical protein [Verrucomicrobiota bacterium]
MPALIITIIGQIAVLAAYFVLTEHRAAWPSDFAIWPWAFYAFHAASLQRAYSLLCAAESIVKRYLALKGESETENETTTLIMSFLTHPHLMIYSWLGVVTSLVSFSILCFMQGWATAITLHVVGAFLLPRVLPMRHKKSIKQIRSRFLDRPALMTVALDQHGISTSELVQAMDAEMSS